MANNSKFDAQMERMQYLMGYKAPSLKESKSNKIEYHTIGADNKVYGILKEGSKYYIMTTEQGKENLSESYSYIGGYNYRNENGFNSYNEATKQLELKLISLNESLGKHEDVSTVDFNRGKKAMISLTEAARKELDRMHQIFENSQVIGMKNVGDPESKVKATDPTKQGDPFEDVAKAELDKDLKATGTVEGATEDVKVDGVEKDLESDAMKTKKVEPAEECKDAHDDLEGEGVADQHPSGAKAVMVNEEMEDDALVGTEEDGEEDGIDAEFDEPEDEEEPEITDDELDKMFTRRKKEDPILKDPKFGDLSMDDEDEYDDGIDYDFLNEFLDDEEEPIEEEDKIEGPDKVLDGPHGELPVQTVQKLTESMDRIVEGICDNLLGKEKEKCEKGICPKCGKKHCECDECGSKQALQEAIDKIVAEEITRLDAWGKHPRYRKAPMTVPANKEKIVANGDRDFNDASTKGEQPYGQKIGNGAPFDKLVDIITDSVKAQLKESKKA